MPSKEVDELVKKYAKGHNPFSDSEIIERALFPLVNEGFKCLEEGIANQPSDIDVVYLYGYGWPIYRGGKSRKLDLCLLSYIDIISNCHS